MGKMQSAAAAAFPGQGIQKPGMAKEVYATSAWRFFEEAGKVLDYDLGRLCLEGSEEQLNDTSYAQVAIFVTCYSLWDLAKGHFAPKVFLGHSLGEITALGAAGAFDFAEGVQLTQARGELMAKAPKGGMAAVLGLKAEHVHELCAKAGQTGYVQVANENSPVQTVVSGDEAGLEALSQLAQEQGAKRVVRLNVSGPFHSRLMEPVAREFAEVVENLSLKRCHTPVLSNDGETLLTEISDIKRKLIEQVTGPVRFTGQVRRLRSLGINEFVEVSPSNLLIPLARRVDPELQFTLVSEGGIM